MLSLAIIGPTAFRVLTKLVAVPAGGFRSPYFQKKMTILPRVFFRVSVPRPSRCTRKSARSLRGAAPVTGLSRGGPVEGRPFADLEVSEETDG